IREDRFQGALDEALEDAIDDRVAEFLLAPEVIVEVSLADSALPQDVVERRAVISPEGDQPGRGVEDLITRRRALVTLRARGHFASAPRSSVPTSWYRLCQSIAGLSRRAGFIRYFSGTYARSGRAVPIERDQLQEIGRQVIELGAAGLPPKRLLNPLAEFGI